MGQGAEKRDGRQNDSVSQRCGPIGHLGNAAICLHEVGRGGASGNGSAGFWKPATRQKCVVAQLPLIVNSGDGRPPEIPE